MVSVAKFIGLIVFGILGTIFGGYVITQLWGWFIVPFGIMNISIAHGIGLNLLMSLMTTKLGMATDPEMKGATLIITSFLLYVVFWGLGYVVSLFM